MDELIMVELVYEKETKNMVRYNAPGGKEAEYQALIPNLYVRKTALAGAFNEFPKRIKVTIEKGKA